MVEDRLSICAIIAVRNELRYLRRLLPLLAVQEVEVAMIDNESTDGSRELYADFMGKPIISFRSRTPIIPTRTITPTFCATIFLSP